MGVMPVTTRAHSAAVAFNVTQAATTTAFTPTPTQVQSGSTFSVSATISTTGFGNAPTGTVTFSIGGQHYLEASRYAGFTWRQYVLGTADNIHRNLHQHNRQPYDHGNL